MSNFKVLEILMYFRLEKLWIVALVSSLTACSTIDTKPKENITNDLIGLDIPGAPPLQKNTENIPVLNNNTTTAPKKVIDNIGKVPEVAPNEAKQPAALSTKASSNELIGLNLEQVELRAVFEMVADALGISVVIDSSIADKVTVRTAPDKSLTQDDLWALLQLLLAENNVSMEKKGIAYHLKKEKKALPDAIGSKKDQLNKSNAPEVLQVTPLRYITVDSALTALKPMVEPEGRLLVISNLNVLGIVTSPEKLNKINKLLALLDADPFVHRGIRLFRLQNAKSSEAKTDLDKILQAVEGKMPAFEIIALDRINSLLVISPPQRGFEEVARWIEIVDERNEAGGEQIFIYRVRNLKATTLATTLKDVFRTDGKETPKTTPKDPNKPDEKHPEQPKPVEQQNPLNQPNQLNNPQNAATAANLKINIVADEETNSLLIRATPRDYRHLLSTIALLDNLPKEVMINVVVAEVELTEGNQFGIDWFSLFNKGAKGFIGSESKIPGAAGVTNGVPTRSDNGLVVSYITGSITGVLNALSTEGRVELLSRPSLLVKNNQEATINVGSDEPTITRMNQTQTGVNTGVTTSNEVQYRKTGIILKVKPQINEDGIVNMTIKQEVSALGAERTAEKLPSFKQRVVDTALVVRDGTAVVMGGLIQTSINNNNEGIPLLKDVPVLGKLFQSQSGSRIRTELVIMIVPQIIQPDADNREYVRQFRDRMSEVKRLMEEDAIPMIVNKTLPAKSEE
jgi:general secretion pathway protein D